jgi:hypothetical protein
MVFKTQLSNNTDAITAEATTRADAITAEALARTTQMVFKTQLFHMDAITAEAYRADAQQQKLTTRARCNNSRSLARTTAWSSKHSAISNNTDAISRNFS